MQPSVSGAWGGGRDANDLLIDRLSVLAGALDPVPAEVTDGARAAFAEALASAWRGSADADGWLAR